MRGEGRRERGGDERGEGEGERGRRGHLSHQLLPSLGQSSIRTALHWVIVDSLLGLRVGGGGRGSGREGSAKDVHFFMVCVFVRERELMRSFGCVSVWLASKGSRLLSCAEREIWGNERGETEGEALRDGAGGWLSCSVSVCVCVLVFVVVLHRQPVDKPDHHRPRKLRNLVFLYNDPPGGEGESVIHLPSQLSGSPLR